MLLTKSNGLTFSQVAETELTLAQNTAIAALIEQIYINADFGGRSYFEQPHHVRFLAHAEGDDTPQLVGHLAGLLRTVRLGDVLWRCMGIAEVATHPNFRRRGIASQLLNDAVTMAWDRGLDAVLLFGTEPLYAKAGFQKATNLLRHVDLTGTQANGIIERDSHALRVLTADNFVWREDQPLDLAGCIF